MHSLSEKIRHDMDILNEGFFRNAGMAATVAAGLMGNPAAHAADTTSLDAKWNNLAQTVQTIPADVRPKVFASLGNPRQYIAKARAENSSKSDGELLDEWLAKAVKLGVDFQANTVPPSTTTDFWNTEKTVHDRLLNR